jgi:hypothetical protein
MTRHLPSRHRLAPAPTIAIGCATGGCACAAHCAARFATAVASCVFTAEHAGCFTRRCCCYSERDDVAAPWRPGQS